jgi:hypothetical protein
MLADARAILSQLDAEISGLSHPPAELRTRRNSYTPLCQLAPEILGRILLFAQIGANGTHIVRTPWIDFDPAWTRCMLVCRHVREVAVGTPILWKFLFLAKEQERTALGWWILCVSRAKNYPLEFVVDLNKDRSVGPREAFLRAHWHRARKMDLDHRSPLQEGIVVLPEEQFPQLEYLRVLTFHTDVTAQFLGGVSTTLTRLELNTISSVIQGAPRLPALRTLKFVTNDTGGSHKDPRHFDMLLLGTPALEALSIHIMGSLSLDFATEDALRAAPTFSLPNLHTLQLIGPRHGLSGLLRMLPRPRSALSITETWWHGTEDLGLFAYLQEFWRETARQEQLPPPRIGCDAHTRAEQDTSMHFELGAPFTFDTDAFEPRIFFRSRCVPGVENFIPMDRVDAIHLMAAYQQFEFQSLVSIRHQIREVILKEYSFDETTETISRLKLWLWPTTQPGHQLEVLRFIQLPTSGFQTTWRLTLNQMQEAGMVKTVLHEVALED